MQAPHNVPFVDFPSETRMHFRGVIDDLGGEVSGYVDRGVSVAMPNGARRQQLQDALIAAGFRITGRQFFPLGTDNPPDHLRHDASYPGSGGFWLYHHYTS